jgi:hypothetical protein
MQKPTDTLPVQAPPRFSAVVVNLFFIVAVLYLFRDILFDTHVLTSSGGDGAKNMYTFLYHILYEKGCWFYGMNYPFGEHVVFTDNQPLFSIPLSYLNAPLHLSIDTLIAFVYWMMAFSFFLGLNFTYKILIHFRVQYLAAIVCSTCIIFLSPQVFRISGHYPLAFSCFLPMLLFWTIRYNETDKRRYLVYLCLLSIVYSFLHMYFLAMSLVWTTGYFAGFWLGRNEHIKRKWRHVLFFILNNVVAISVLEVFLALTDPFKDRPVIPYTGPPPEILPALFTTTRSPVWESIEKAGVVTTVNDNSEGGAYCGFAMMIMIVVGIILWSRWKIKRNKQVFHIPFPAVWVVLAITTLVFAMGIDHIWDLELLKRVLRPFRQFRVPERFSWIFYYVMSVYTAVALYAVFSFLYLRSKRVLASVIGILVLGIWMLEAIGYVNAVDKEAGSWKANYNDFFMKDGKTWTRFLSSHQLKNTDFQSILMLPYVHIGSEKLWINEDCTFPFSFAFGASLETGLPIMDVLMSRSSWSQTFKQAKISAGLIADKPVLNLVKNERILLMHFTEYAIDPDAQEVLNSSDYIGNFKGCDMYAFYPSRLLARHVAYCAGLRQMATAQVPADSVYGNKQQCVTEHFDQSKAPYCLAGTGAMAAVSGSDSLIAVLHVPYVADSGQYEFSGWARFTEADASYCFFVLVFKDSSNKELHRFDILGKNSADNEPGFWFRLNKFFKMPEKTATIEVYIQHNGERSYFALDELLLRPVRATVICKMKDGTVLANNHILVAGSDRK